MINHSIHARCGQLGLRLAIAAALSLTTPYLFAQDEPLASGVVGTSTDSQSDSTPLSSQDYLGKFQPGMPDGRGGELSKGEFADRQGLVIQQTMAALETPECPPFMVRNGFESGSLSRGSDANAANDYVTSGGYLIRVQFYTISIYDPYRMNSVQFWGDPHENLNGKHVKDWGSLRENWDTNRRTIVLDDGTKITMTAAGPTGVTETTSIYDGSRNVQIDNPSNTVSHYANDLADTQTREAAQYDGETAVFTTDRSTLVASYTDTHNENAAFVILNEIIPIGTTGGCANRMQVNDMFP